MYRGYNSNTGAPNGAAPNHNTQFPSEEAPSTGSSRTFGVNANANASTGITFASVPAPLSRSNSLGGLRFTPMAPRYRPMTPNFQSTQPEFQPTALRFKPMAPSYTPMASDFQPTEADFQSTAIRPTPMAPRYTPNAPSYTPMAPEFQPRAHRFMPTNSGYTQMTPSFQPTEPVFQPTTPSWVRPITQHQTSLLRSNSFNSPGNPFRRNASNSNANNGSVRAESSSTNGTLHRADSSSGNQFTNEAVNANTTTASQIGEDHITTSDRVWRNLCEIAGLDVEVLLAQFHQAYSAQDRNEFLSFRQDLLLTFIHAGTTQAEAERARESFCFWALEKVAGLR